MNRISRLACVALIGAGLTATTVPTAQAAPSIRSKALKTAAAQEGDPYRKGAAGPHRFDCSGLLYYAYRKHGKTLPRTAQAQYDKAKKISPSKRKVGDLIFIGRSAKDIYHAGIYAGWKDGKGWMWNANTGSYRGKKVVLAPIKEYTKGSPRAYYGRIYG